MRPKYHAPLWPPRIASINVRALCLLAAVALAWPLAASEATVPVRIGLDDPSLDACISQGEVFGLTPGGDGFLAVRAGPGKRYAMIDGLAEGRLFHICDSSADREWIGIVYNADGSLNCDVGSPVESPRDYRGECKSGWINKQWVRVVAG